MQTTSITSIAACLIAAGCASHEIGGGEYDEIAQIVGASIATPDGGGAYGGAADSARLAFGELPRGFVGDPGGMSTGEHFGVSYTYMAFCTDAAGTRLDCSPGATAATVIASWDGPLAMSEFGGTVQRQGTWTLTGMTTGMAALAGTSELTYDASFAASAASYHLTITETIAASLDMSSPAIAGGTITSQLHVERTVDAGHGTQRWDYDVGATVTFTTEAAKLVLDGAYAYRVDFASGAVTPWYVR